MRDVIEEVGWVQDVIVNTTTGHIVDGHMRNLLALEAGEKVPVVWVELSLREERLILATFDPIGMMAERDEAALASLFTELADEDRELLALIHQLDGAEVDDDGKAGSGALAERFLVPPFSVLDARQGYWQERKRAWLSLGIQSEIGRGGNLLKMSDTVRKSGKMAGKAGVWFDPKGKTNDKYKEVVYDTEDLTGGWSGTSVFDPVLCELVYRWFCPKDGTILDPFAGGSVRGIVAAKLGFKYEGLELRQEQIDANRAQAKALKCTAKIKWRAGDATKNITSMGAGGKRFDMVFSCPPYFDLERYSENPADLSNCRNYSQFLGLYASVIDNCVKRLRANSFACFVVSNIRDDKGMYRNLVGDTIRAFVDAGAQLYNDAVLVQPIGSLPLRIGKQFNRYRKLGKTHQNVLVFYNGDPKQITKRLGEANYTADDWLELYGVPPGTEAEVAE